jgi:hypothetical protein
MPVISASISPQVVLRKEFQQVPKAFNTIAAAL